MIDEQYGVKGVLTIKEFSKETGELLSSWTDENVITTLGMNTLFLRAALPDEEETMIFHRFCIGIDTGDNEDPSGGWDDLNPRPAKKEYTSLNQYVVYEVHPEDMVYDHISTHEFQASTLLDGEYVLNTFYPDDPDIRYTSATLRFENDTTFSYKRFPVRSLSRLIDVQLMWSFTFENKDGFC